jgi:hypothetical protein
VTFDKKSNIKKARWSNDLPKMTSYLAQLLAIRVETTLLKVPVGERVEYAFESVFIERVNRYQVKMPQ